MSRASIIDEILKVDFSDVFDDYEEWADAFAYQGFDPVRIYEIISALKAKKMTVDGASVEVTWKLALVWIVEWYLIRGAQIKTNRTGSKGSSKITAAKDFLGVKMTTPETSAAALGKDDVTVSRLIAVFARQIATIIKTLNETKGFMMRIGPGSEGTLGATLPMWLCFPQAASLLTIDGPYWSEFVSWTAFFDDVVNRPTPKRKDRRDAARAKEYAEIGARANFYTDAQKRQFLETMGSRAGLSSAAARAAAGPKK
jgi:hypothetical protein